MNCIIIDDEVLCIGSLKILLEQNFPEITFLGSCTDGVQGLDLIEKCNPDLVFLDISMPKMGGFEMLEQIEKIDFKIIFTTAHEQHALKAFKVSAMDYLLKPVNIEDLNRAIQKIKSSEQIQLSHIKSFIDSQLRPENHKSLTIPTIEGFEIIKQKDILYLISHSNYTEIHLSNNESKIVSKTLGDIEGKLDNQFVRIHRSAVINIDHLKKYIKGEGGYVVMVNGQHLDVSRRRKSSFIKKLN